jgi:site-specific DNA-methyltransferase (adenine-specific)/modification methylase
MSQRGNTIASTETAGALAHGTLDPFVGLRPCFLADGIALYHGDCRKILPLLKVDVIISDPPYGIRYSPGGGGRGWTKKVFTGKDIIVGDNVPFDPAPFLSFRKVALFGANHYSDRVPGSPGWVVWDKKRPGLVNSFSDCELIYTSRRCPARMFRHLWNGCMKASERGVKRLHPTQKPVALMEWLLDFMGVDADEVVCDPFCGVGTTLVAARNKGRKAIGIEIEEKYIRKTIARLTAEQPNKRVSGPRPAQEA